MQVQQKYQPNSNSQELKIDTSLNIVMLIENESHSFEDDNSRNDFFKHFSPILACINVFSERRIVLQIELILHNRLHSHGIRSQPLQWIDLLLTLTRHSVKALITECEKEIIFGGKVKIDVVRSAKSVL